MDNFTGQIVTTLLALAFVGALAWVSLNLLKRVQQGRGGAADGKPGGDLRFVRALQLGAKERIVLLQYRNEEWMVGVTAGNISLLARTPLQSPSQANDVRGLPVNQ